MASIFDELEREWPRLVERPEVARSLSDVCSIVDVGHPRELVAQMREATPTASNAVLAVLVARATAGDGLAGRVTLQLLLPGARRLARRWPRLGDPDERAAMAVAAFWAQIRRYPLTRRPRAIAANIVWDAIHEIHRMLQRRDRVHAVQVEADQLPAERSPLAAAAHPASELLQVVADAVDQGLVSREDAELIVSSRVGDTPTWQLAQRRGIALRTVQWRRQRAEAALARLAAA